MAAGAAESLRSPHCRFDNLADSKPWLAGDGPSTSTCARESPYLTAADINAELLPWLARNPAGPWFALVHYWDAHSPYLPPEPYRRRHYEGDPGHRSVRRVGPLEGRAQLPVRIAGRSVTTSRSETLILYGACTTPHPRTSTTSCNLSYRSCRMATTTSS